MRRLFNAADGRLLDVAIDHGVFNEDRFLDGIEGEGPRREVEKGLGNPFRNDL